MEGLRKEQVVGSWIMTSDELKGMLESGQAVTILDVRQKSEREEWSIPGSVHADVYQALRAGDENALREMDLPRDREVVTVCGAGITSLIGAQQLRTRGYRAFSLEGGMKAWSLMWNLADVHLPDAKGQDVQVVQIRRTGKGCLSYIIGSAGEAAVIDASVDPEIYIEVARERGWKITHTLDTHIHADHLSRSRRLAELTGATLWLPANNRVDYAYSALREGANLEFGAAQITALETPGHTGESVCYVLEGGALFTGDTLFLQGVGRPDLEAGTDEAARRARLLWGSLRRLESLPQDALVLPGHTSEPVPFDGVPVTAPLGQIRRQVPMLSMDEEQFAKTILSRILSAPPNHNRIISLNETGWSVDVDPVELEAGANRCAVS
jgi:glyoxylase-like metal-dependent hydrolase (beta-lactamase superfamily II)/rhodanese-related sulfurtransferase